MSELKNIILKFPEKKPKYNAERDLMNLQIQALCKACKTLKTVSDDAYSKGDFEIANNLNHSLILTGQTIEKIYNRYTKL